MLDALLERVESVEDGDEELLALLEGSRALRVEAYTRALAVGPDGRGAAGVILWGELERLGTSPGDVEELAEALAAAGSLRFAGVCAETSVEALGRLPDGTRRVENFAAAADPSDELQAVLILTLLASDFGESVRGLAPRAVATLLASSDVQADVDDVEPVDAEVVRGALDALQLPYEDVNASRWRVRIPYRDELEQRKGLEADLGLTGRSLVLRAGGLQAESEGLLMFNHTSGLARFGRGLDGDVSIVAEVDRRGFTFEVFERLVQDFTAAVERVAGPGRG